MKLRIYPLILAAVMVAGCTVSQTQRKWKLDKTYGAPDAAARSRYARQAKGIDFVQQVQPIFAHRCTLCHACYDAPCQLKLSSYEGLERGASKERVYNNTRLLAAQMTRLGVDAHDAAEWRTKRFSPVLNERQPSPESNRDGSVLVQMLELKKKNPLPPTRTLAGFDFSLDRKEQCPTIEEFDVFAKKCPLWGMPYGLPGLTDSERQVLTGWVEQGAPYADPPSPDSETQKLVARWERFLNGDTLKEQLMSRYLYEHLFLAHFYFTNRPEAGFFDMVRSKTPPGQPVVNIPTRRVMDEPGVPRVYYRLIRDDSIIVSKRHLPYALNAQRMDRWKQLFLQPDYEVKKFPSYDTETAANPFATFRDIPVRSRYEFLLDDAQFFVMGFIKGPVCRGQVALNVIDDQFWIFFINPAALKEAPIDKFLADNSEYLQLPASSSSNAIILFNWHKYASLYDKYVDERLKLYRSALAKPELFTLKSIWNGNRNNPNAALTVFRHVDSASVVQGLVGGKPKTSLVVGYSLFERIHYLLVAGFDVFGNVGHQVNTRVYMDFLRMEGESQFLAFLPKSERAKQRDLWYRGADDDVKQYVYGEKAPFDHEAGIVYRTQDPKSELYDMLKGHLGKANPSTYQLDEKIKDPAVRRELLRLAALKGRPLGHLAPVTYLRIPEDGYFTIIVNAAHANITGLMDQEKQRLPDEDTLTVVYGFIGDYPDVFTEVHASKLASFVDQVASLQREEDYSALLDSYGIRRTSPRFWDACDDFIDGQQKFGGIAAGLFDLNRYNNR